MKIKRNVASSESEIETMLRNFATANASDDVELDEDNEVDADDDEDLEDDADDVGDDDEDLNIDDDSDDDDEDLDSDDSEDDDGEGDDDSEDEDLDNEDLEDDVESSDDSEDDSDDGEGDDDYSEDDEDLDNEDSDDDEDLDSEDDSDSSDDSEDDDGEGDDDSEDEDFDIDDEDDVESSDDDDLDDIEAVLASADDVVETLIATGAVAVIIPTAPHDFQAVAAAFDAHEDEEVDASDDEDFDLDDEDNEVDASSDDEDSDAEDEDGDDEEVNVSDDDCDDDDTDASDDDDEEIVIDEDIDDEDDDSSDDDSDDDLDDEVDANEDESLELDEEQLAPVVDIESIASAEAEDVDLHLYVNADTNDAWWNVTVKGIPAARIVKSSLDSKVHAFFLKDEFAANIKQAIASEGLSAVLEGAHAEYYANAYLNSELADQVRAEYEAEASENYTAKTADLRDKFIDVVKLVTAGIAKNYFPEVGSPIKAALFEELDEAGLDNPAEPIEAAFAKANEAHFDAIFAKATELMDKSPEFIEDLRETIAGAGVINTQHEVDDEDEETVATASFMTRLASGGSVASQKRGISRLADM